LSIGQRATLLRLARRVVILPVVSRRITRLCSIGDSSACARAIG
jgi:hypothetical protein